MVSFGGQFGGRIAAAVAIGVLVVGCSGADDGAKSRDATEEPEEVAFQAEEFAPTGGDFYAAPDPLPEADHGTLLRYEKVDSSLDGGTVWKVMYLSESMAGDPIPVSGVIVVPDGEPPAEGWKLLSVAHGTTGIGDDCTPSHNKDDIYVGLSGSFVSNGYVVAVTDYEGLGTPGIHPYLVGESEGRGVVDAARAAHQLPDVTIGERYAIWGYSQGGHGAAWANEIAAEWAPDLDLAGTVAGAPPSEMQAIFSALGTTPLSPDFFFMTVAGYAAAYPDLDPADILTPAGLDVLDQADDGCFGIGAAMGGRPMSDFVKPDFAAAEPWATRLAENDPGQQAVDSPLLILHSSADNVVPAGLSQAMFTRMCGLDQVVERRVYEKGQGHGDAVPDAVVDGYAWIDGVFTGDKPAISSCN